MGIPDHLTCLLKNLHADQEVTVRTEHGTTDWFQIRKGVCQGCTLSPCLFNLYAEYIMWNAGLDEAQAGIKISRRNINNLIYADDTTLMAESKEYVLQDPCWGGDPKASLPEGHFTIFWCRSGGVPPNSHQYWGHLRITAYLGQQGKFLLGKGHWNSYEFLRTGYQRTAYQAALPSLRKLWEELGTCISYNVWILEKE